MARSISELATNNGEVTMAVTKQQQLEWLAKQCVVWPGFHQIPLRMSVVIIGGINHGLGPCHAITRQEWQQERDKMQKQAAKPVQPSPDNSWHERGELPPVGCECDIRHSCWNSEKYEKVTVAAITNEYLIVKYATFEQHYMLKDISFRPIRTEREKAIDAACEAIGGVGEDGLLIIERIYDAGLLK